MQWDRECSFLEILYPIFVKDKFLITTSPKRGRAGLKYNDNNRGSDKCTTVKRK
jgi:hypothetical protein